MKLVSTYAQKRIHECQFCSLPIERGQRMAVGVSYNRTSKKRTVRYWHLGPSLKEMRGLAEDCYSKQQHSYLDMRQFEPVGTMGHGRPALDITEEQKKQRRKLLVEAAQNRLQRRVLAGQIDSLKQLAQDSPDVQVLVDNAMKQYEALRFSHDAIRSQLVDGLGGLPSHKFKSGLEDIWK